MSSLNGPKVPDSITSHEDKIAEALDNARISGGHDEDSGMTERLHGILHLIDGLTEGSRHRHT
jgi:hypothetical protein